MNIHTKVLTVVKKLRMINMQQTSAIAFSALFSVKVRKERSVWIKYV